MKKSSHGMGTHSKHGHSMMHEVHKAEGGKVEGIKLSSSSDGTSSGLPNSSGAMAGAGTGYAKGEKGMD